jgi:hypothetical protein
MIRHLLYIFAFSLTAGFIGFQSLRLSFPVPGHHEFTNRELPVKEMAAGVFSTYSIPGRWLPEKSFLALAIDSSFWGGILYGVFRLATIASKRNQRLSSCSKQ